MKKIIKIGGKDYTMNASALTQFSYKDETGNSFLQDLKKLSQLADKKISMEDLDVLDQINNLILPIAFIMTKEADSTQVTDYKSFLKGIDNLYEDFSWIEQVILLACSPISGQLQNN